ncbi:hypothetical protein CROQUDRAFT_457786 [Cronartium quercuum f. sp. fusiforme G11]|uniref:Uncharacterized protein n=1 Tax=Cronartium quercuum f. sp. fusiforme G11 TaxID=708437 RepID=A0A9P6N8Q9_9BASI|nr:hypothetical protein CROQUDRAFT_457786 [Cronartium quercuum f. sp. fusiforme G11]
MKTKPSGETSKASSINKVKKKTSTMYYSSDTSFSDSSSCDLDFSSNDSDSSDEDPYDPKYFKKPRQISHTIEFRLGDDIDDFLRLYEEQADIDSVCTEGMAKQVI